MKHFCILLIFVLSHFNCFVSAQDVSLEWGNDVKKSRSGDPSYVLGKDETGFYVIKNSGSIYIEKFDLNMNILWTKKIEIYLTKVSKTSFENVLITKNKLIVFTSFYDSKANTKQLFATHISKGGVIDTKLYEVNLFENLTSRHDVYFDVQLSKKTNSILIFSNFRERDDQKETFHYKVIDENFVEKSHAVIELPYKGTNTSIMDYVIDNAGNIHLIYSVNLKREEENNKSNDDRIDFNYYIMSYYPSTKEYKEYDMRVGNYLITGISILIDDDSRFMYVPGFYSEKKINALRGTIISKIDLLNRQVVYSKQQVFDDAFLAVVYAKPLDDDDNKKESKSKKKAKGKDQLYDYDIREVFVNEAEEIVMVSEQYYMHAVTHTTTSANGTTTTYTTYYYHYNNVLVSKFGTTGDRQWCSNIPKYQVTTNDGGFFSSIGVFAHKDMVYIIFNDNPKNGTGIAAKQYRTINPQKSQLTMVSLDGSGTLKKRVLMPAPQYGKGIGTRPKFSSQVSPNEVILLGYIHGTYKLGKIDLK